MSTETTQTTATTTPDKPKVNRRTFTERLSDLSLEEKVAVVKLLKAEIADELARREQSAKEAASLTQGL